MARLVLGPLLRHVSETTATIWVETDQPCAVDVLGRSARTFTIAGHHYALVIVDDLEPGSTIRYEVHLDGERCWPLPASTFPPSVIRTLGPGPLRILFGSCRTAAPHKPPWNLELDHDDRGRGVDAIHAYGLRMLSEQPDEWPNLLLFVGDQVYADDSSPRTRDRVEQRRGHLTKDDHYPGIDDVADFEEYTWLYHESWMPDVERWVLSVVPSTMIFDDHDMIDDWNTSISWLRDIRREPWWRDHIIGGLMSYWVYQHLGNLSPDEITAEGMLERFVELGDATSTLTDWAVECEASTSLPGGYRFSFYRDLAPVRLVVIDCRHGRMLEPGARRMIDEREWDWVVRHSAVECNHLLFATSVPVAMPGGLHDLEQWNEVVCNGAWGTLAGRFAEWVRRAVDLEDWAAFHDSYVELMGLVRRLGTSHDESPEPPATITILSGDVHFSYRARATFDELGAKPTPTSRVHQIVNSPIRNVLPTRERRALKLGLSPLGGLVGRALRRSVGRRPDTSRWALEDGPHFANHVCLVEFDGRNATMILPRAEPDNFGEPKLTEVATSAL